MFRGKFKFKNTTGSPIVYSIDDIVLHEGKAYKCKRQTFLSPLQEKNSWKFIGLTEAQESENPPINPVEGQVWVSQAGKSYYWYVDANSSQWIET